MSSILIKGMDIPKHAVRNGTDDTMYRSCVLVHPNGTAELVVDLEFADQFNFDHNLKRFPLVEIPTPHGDLIEKEQLKQLLFDLWQSGCNYTISDLMREIVDIKPIIEAEEQP